MIEIATSGYLKIGCEADRLAMASILVKNGYTVSPVRKKKDGKTKEYYIFYQLNDLDIVEGKT